MRSRAMFASAMSSSSIGAWPHHSDRRCPSTSALSARRNVYCTSGVSAAVMVVIGERSHASVYFHASGPSRSRLRLGEPGPPRFLNVDVKIGFDEPVNLSDKLLKRPRNCWGLSSCGAVPKTRYDWPQRTAINNSPQLRNTCRIFGIRRLSNNQISDDTEVILKASASDDAVCTEVPNARLPNYTVTSRTSMVALSFLVATGGRDA